MDREIRSLALAIKDMEPRERLAAADVLIAAVLKNPPAYSNWRRQLGFVEISMELMEAAPDQVREMMRFGIVLRLEVDHGASGLEAANTYRYLLSCPWFDVLVEGEGIPIYRPSWERVDDVLHFKGFEKWIEATQRD
jgi:hypothetical protein